ncbi:hypothetical protein M413DRAFT_42625, partial [Hebeloma cylindrosporum]
HLYDTSVLQQIGLVVNTPWQLLICTDCQIALPPTNFFGHFRSKHAAITIDSAFRQDISAHVGDFGLPTEFPAIPTTLIPSISGLKILEALYCPHCLAVHQHPDTMVHHHRTAHPDTPRPSSWATGPVQRFHDGVGRQAFRILPSDVQHDNVSFDIPSILSDMESAEKALTPDLDVRNITPWLRIT